MNIGLLLEIVYCVNFLNKIEFTMEMYNDHSKHVQQSYNSILDSSLTTLSITPRRLVKAQVC